MMRAIAATMIIGASLTLAGCANDSLLGGIGGEASQPTAALPAKPPVDPACNALAARIDALRKEGVVERVEAASKGKGSSVSVKRASLGQIAELEKVNAEFQAKCSTVPRSASAPATPQPPQAAAAAVAAKAAAKTAAAQPKATAAGVAAAATPVAPAKQ